MRYNGRMTSSRQGLPASDAPRETSKLSQRCQDVLQGEETQRLYGLHVMLKPGIDSVVVEQTVARLAGLVTDPESLRSWERTGIVYCSTSIDTVPAIAELAEVVWVDIESESPIEELID